MKLTIENIKVSYQILIIKLLIVVLFVSTIISGLNGISHYYNVAGNNGGLTEYLSIAFNYSYLRPAAIMLIPLIGVFISKKIGWILTMSFFYFILSNIVFSFGDNGSNDTTPLLIKIIAIILSLIVIFIMNKKVISNLTFGITQTELISSNIIASIIGMSITISLVLLKANGM